MKWTWEHKDWPNYSFDEAKFAQLGEEFMQNYGVLSGSVKHLNSPDKDTLRVEIISDEAFNTSEIEGEFLNRDSLKSSIRQNLGLKTDPKRSTPAEQGVADMMVQMHRTYDQDLSHQELFTWHTMLMTGRRDLLDIGAYRTHEDPMQIVSGALGNQRVHYEAPPSERVEKDMDTFVRWFNNTAPDQQDKLPALLRAGLAHLQFETIHPFEDGNGRIGRALAEKTISQGLRASTPLALSHVISRNKKEYYSELNRASTTLNTDRWLNYFCNLVLEAQKQTIKMVDFIIAKGKFFELHGDKINTRQEKVIKRIFKEGLQGFSGGLSAENYISITGAPRATVTRDLQSLVSMGALTKTGERKHTRYFLSTEV